MVTLFKETKSMVVCCFYLLFLSLLRSVTQADEMKSASKVLSEGLRSLISRDLIQNQNNTVYLTHVKWVSGKEQLTKYFSRYGTIKDVSLFFVSYLRKLLVLLLLLGY